MIALLIDIGNSRVKWRIADVDGGAASAGEPRWLSDGQALALRVAPDLEAAFRTDPAGRSPPNIDVVFVSNVASEADGATVLNAVTRTWQDAAVRWVRPTAAQCGVVNGYRDPLQLGVDRWLAAIAAHALCPDRSVLVCSFGTATTIDLVELAEPGTTGAVFVGGLILPGIDAMQAALTAATARLPTRAGQVVDFADRTEDAMISGIMAAQIGAVERAIARMRTRRPADDRLSPPATCIVAGGGAQRMTALLAELDLPHRVVHDLVLRGLALVAAQTVGPASELTRPATNSS